MSRIRRPSEKRAADVAFVDLAFVQGHLEGLARALEYVPEPAPPPPDRVPSGGRRAAEGRASGARRPMIWPPRHVIVGLVVILAGDAMVYAFGYPSWRTLGIALGGGVMMLGSHTFHGD